MPAPSSPPWTSGSRRHPRYGGADLRASDAERTEVADRLSRHYQDGRLDQAEFNERMDRAMSAKTRADFSGLFADLPDLPDTPDQQAQPSPPVSGVLRQRRPAPNVFLQFGTIALVVVLAVVLAHSVLHSWLFWLVIAFFAFIWLRNEDRRHRR
jgi:Flp pilus assembly protein TadB